MSAFLGTIHVKMYDKILYQDEMSNALLRLAESCDWCDTLAKQSSLPAAAPLESLADIIDPNHIHGWLSLAVENCERRLAMVVSHILTGHEERFEDIICVMTQLGNKQKLSPGFTSEEAYRQIHDLLLDGMPCDFPFQITSTDERVVTWQVVTCPHTEYWHLFGGAEVYYKLRDAWVSGMLEGSGLIHVRDEANHIIRKDV